MREKPYSLVNARLQTNNLKIDVEALNKLLASQMFVVPAFQVRQQGQLFPDAWFALTLFACILLRFTVVSLVSTITVLLVVRSRYRGSAHCVACPSSDAKLTARQTQLHAFCCALPEQHFESVEAALCAPGEHAGD